MTQIKQRISKEDVDEENIGTYLCQEMTEKQIVGKLAEECAELLEVLLKFMTRRPGKEPSKEKITEEMGDVFVRMAVAAEKFDIMQAVEDRVEYKGNFLIEKAKAGYFEEEITEV